MADLRGRQLVRFALTPSDFGRKVVVLKSLKSSSTDLLAAVAFRRAQTFGCFQQDIWRR